MFRQIFMYFSVPITTCPIVGHQWEKASSNFFIFSMIGSPLSLLFSILNNPSSLSLSSCETCFGFLITWALMKGIKQPEIHYKICYWWPVIYELYGLFFFLFKRLNLISSSYKLSFHLSDDVSTVKKEQITFSIPNYKGWITEKV